MRLAILRLRQLTARFGLRRTARVVLLWILRQAAGYRSAVIYCASLEHPAPVPASPALRCTFAHSSLIAPPLLNAVGLSAHDLERLESSGDRCFVGSLEERQCYFSLVSTRGFTIPGRFSFKFNNAVDAYVGNCLTLDSYRGSGIYPASLAELGRQLRAEGRSRLYLFVERENLASTRSVEKAGFRAVARCSVFHFDGRPRCRWRVLREAEMETLRAWTIEPPPAG